MFVDGAPYFVRGMGYVINPVGESPEGGGRPWTDWAFSDVNHNGRIDGPFDAWVDANQNNKQDPDEPTVGDFQLMKEMGVNTIRWYCNAYPPNQKTNKELFRELFEKYGIRVVAGDYFGAYAIASGATYEQGTDYRDPVQQEKMLASVRQMVLENKDEPYLLLWLLGNENNLSLTHTNASQYPEAYARFLNRAAQLIHELDGKHPVALSHGGGSEFLKFYKQFAPDVDILGANAYMGAYGFGLFWKDVRKDYGKPILYTEYAGNENVTEKGQVAYHRGCWRDIEKNRAGGSGAGNALGGLAQEWLDRWWPGGDPDHHATVDMSQSISSGHAWNQEYAGFCTQGDGSQSPFLRQLRPVYYLYKDELWKNPDKPPAP